MIIIAAITILFINAATMLVIATKQLIATDEHAE